MDYRVESFVKGEEISGGSGRDDPPLGAQLILTSAVILLPSRASFIRICPVLCRLVVVPPRCSMYRPRSSPAHCAGFMAVVTQRIPAARRFSMKSSDRSERCSSRPFLIGFRKLLPFRSPIFFSFFIDSNWKKFCIFSKRFSFLSFFPSFFSLFQAGIKLWRV